MKRERGNEQKHDSQVQNRWWVTQKPRANIQISGRTQLLVTDLCPACWKNKPAG